MNTHKVYAVNGGFLFRMKTERKKKLEKSFLFFFKSSMVIILKESNWSHWFVTGNLKNVFDYNKKKRRKKRGKSGEEKKNERQEKYFVWVHNVVKINKLVNCHGNHRFDKEMLICSLLNLCYGKGKLYTLYGYQQTIIFFLQIIFLDSFALTNFFCLWWKLVETSFYQKNKIYFATWHRTQ